MGAVKWLLMSDVASIEAVIRQAVYAESAKFSGTQSAKTDVRPYKCSVNGCERNGYARGLCNAHHIRRRNGFPMDLPIRNRSRGTKCVDCCVAIGGKGGWQRCSRHFKVRRLVVIKTALVNALGGRCSACKQSFPLAAYDFHHVGAKDTPVANLMANGSYRRLANEIARCVLLCANCHRIEHNE